MHCTHDGSRTSAFGGSPFADMVWAGTRTEGDDTDKSPFALICDEWALMNRDTLDYQTADDSR